VKAKRNPPGSLILFGLDVTRKEEALLTQSNLTRLFSYGDDWESDPADPEVHKGVDVLTRRLAQGRPQVVGSGVGVLVGFEVVGNTLQEDLLAKVSAQHADD